MSRKIKELIYYCNRTETITAVTIDCEQISVHMLRVIQTDFCYMLNAKVWQANARVKSP